MSMSRFLAQAAMQEDQFVTWFPSYGAEVRGGTAHSMLIISDAPIASPFIGQADTLVAMNQPSLDRFILRVRPKGLALINGSLINKLPKRKNIKIVKRPFTEIAVDLGNVRMANVVALGALCKLKALVKFNSLLAVLRESFINEQLFLANERALRYGARLTTQRRTRR